MTLRSRRSLVGLVILALVVVLALSALATEGTHSQEAKHEEGAPLLPSVVGLLTHHEGFFYHWIYVIYGLLTSLFLCGVAVIVYRRRSLIPGPLQNFVEVLVEWMYNFVHSILGEDARKYTPFIGTLFFYILINNLWGLIPGGESPSTSISITASLALLVFVYAQYTGIRRMGIIGYLDHMAGEPRSAITWAMVWLLFPIHVIGELAKPFSLAVRLFGNITGEDVLVAAFVVLGITISTALHIPVGLPLNIPFLLLGFLLSTIQALVFATLSTIYILLMLPHEEHH